MVIPFSTFQFSSINIFHSEHCLQFLYPIYLYRFKYIPDEEAVIALKEQAQRYDRFRRQKKARLSPRELDSQKMSRNSDIATQITDKHESMVPLPDYVKAKIDREEDIRKNGVFRHAIANRSLNWRNSLMIEAKDIVQVQPATHIDPFSKEGEKLGTLSLRQSNTEYVKHTTLSVIIPSIYGQFIRDYSRIDLTQKWYVFVPFWYHCSRTTQSHVRLARPPMQV